MCLAKGLTGGFLPLGVTAVREELFDSFCSSDRTRTLYHGHSYTANPLACSAARASLALLDGAARARRASIEADHRHHLATLRTHPRVRSPRVLGTLAAFDLPGELSYFHPAGTALAEFALREGVLLRPLGNVVYLLPPYCATSADLDTAYAVIRAFLERRC